MPCESSKDIKFQLLWYTSHPFQINHKQGPRDRLINTSKVKHILNSSTRHHSLKIELNTKYVQVSVTIHFNSFLLSTRMCKDLWHCVKLLLHIQHSYLMNYWPHIFFNVHWQLLCTETIYRHHHNIKSNLNAFKTGNKWVWVNFWAKHYMIFSKTTS